jgi:FAD/FMN-containing dehydrogenase
MASAQSKFLCMYRIIQLTDFRVGVGGHILHGGWGYSTHNHGLFLDYLEEAEVVLADSSVVTASKTKNPELFWGLRGAGMSFGIATNFKFRTLPEPEELQLFYLPFNWDVPQSAAGWKLFQEYTSSTLRPKEMNIRIVIVTAQSFGFPGSLFLVEGGYHGTRAEYEAAIEPFLTAAKKIGGFKDANFTGLPQVTSVNYLDSLLYVNNNALIGTDSGEQLASTPDEQLVSPAVYHSL